MEWRNKYDSTDAYISEPGTQFTPIYQPSLDENGNIEIVQTGEKNHYDEIQSHAQSVDINTIMARYMIDGDESVLNRRQGQYIDVTDMPNNFTELLQRVIIANRDFENLPEEIRNQYSSVEEFVNDIGSEKWNSLFNKQEEEEEIVQTEEVADE